MYELVGEDRVALVDALVDRVDALCAGTKVPRVVVLEAEAGAGKSRLVRELYERLRQRESPDGAAHYWPGLDDRAAGTINGGEPLPSRKVVGPKIDGFLWPANVVPAFVWWDISCEAFGTGEAVAVTDRFESWWAAHGTAMWWAWNTRAGNLEQLAQSRDSVIDSARSALQESAVEGVGELIQMTGLPTLGLGWALSTSGKVLTAVQTRRERKQDLMGELVHEADTDSRGQEIATALIQLARPDLPVVLAIEDAHRMGPDLAALLDALAAPNSTHPVLVVATAWPEGRNNPDWNNWLVRHQAPGTAEVQELDPLEDGDLETLFRAHAPATDPGTTAAVVQRWRNPFALELLMTWDVIEGNVRDNNGALVMSEEDLKDLPEGVVDLLVKRWGSLPKNVRRALALARAGLGEQGLGTEPFIRDIIAAAGARLVEDSDPVGLPLSLQSAAEMRWLRTLDITDALADVLVADMIRDRLNGVIGRSGVAGMRAAVINELRIQINRNRGNGYRLDDTDKNRTIANWLLSLDDTEEDTDAADPEALAAACILAAEALANSYRYTEAIQLLRSAIELAALTPEHPDILTTRSNLAFLLGVSGDTAAAIAATKAVLTAQIHIRGADDAETLTTRNHLAILLGESGDLAGAITATQALLTDRLRVLGQYDSETLSTRSYLGFLLGESGDIAGAITVTQALLTDQVRILDHDDAATLSTRRYLGFLLGESGDIAGAITVTQALLTDQVRILGLEDPDTLTTLTFLSNLAVLLGESGDIAGAITAAQELLTHELCILGPDHPDTLTTLTRRSNLAVRLGESGSLEGAITAFETLLADQNRILGPNHASSLTTRNNLASCLGESGDIAGAITAFEALLTDQIRVLGRDHPDTLITRGNLAFLLGESGDITGAITANNALLADEIRVLGPDHPDTLITRGNLANMLGESGDHAGAIAACEALLTDQIRFLEHDHPDTLITQESLAYWHDLAREGSGASSTPDANAS